MDIVEPSFRLLVNRFTRDLPHFHHPVPHRAPYEDPVRAASVARRITQALASLIRSASLAGLV